MKVKHSTHLTIKLQESDIDNLISGLKKIIEREKEIGFGKGILNDHERETFQNLFDKIK